LKRVFLEYKKLMGWHKKVWRCRRSSLETKGAMGTIRCKKKWPSFQGAAAFDLGLINRL